MSQNHNALNLLVAASEKYATGLDELAQLLVKDQIRVAHQTLNEVLNLNESLAHEVSRLQEQLTSRRDPVVPDKKGPDYANQEPLVFEEVT